MSAKPVYFRGKVQAWTDKFGVKHAVGFKAEPFKLLCHPVPLWGYHPKLAEIADITCHKCREVMDNEL